MRIIKTVLVVLALGALPLHAADTPSNALDQVVDRIISTEQTEMNSLKPFTPLVETYIQNLKGDNNLGAVPAGDKYFLGRAVLAKGVDLDPLTDGSDIQGRQEEDVRRPRQHVLPAHGVFAAGFPADDLSGHERLRQAALQV